MTHCWIYIIFRGTYRHLKTLKKTDILNCTAAFFVLMFCLLLHFIWKFMYFGVKQWKTQILLNQMTVLVFKSFSFVSLYL
jgi:hypothetical protein